MPAPHERSSGEIWLAAAVVVVAGIAAYAGTFHAPFHYDDQATIIDNASIRHLGSALWPSPGTTASGRPVLNLSLAINYAISGTRVWSYHAVNLLIHILAGLVLFGVVRRTFILTGRSGMSGTQEEGTRAIVAAVAVALIWELHPLQTEAVTYISQRAESLMGLFYLLTLYCFIRTVEGQQRFDSHSHSNSHFGFACPAVGFCLLGMATKESMVSAPVVVFLYDRTFVAGSFADAWRRRWRIHAGLAATWIVLAALVLATGDRAHTAGFGSGAPVMRYWLVQCQAIAHYLRLCFWPHPLIFDYGTALTGTGFGIAPALLVVGGLVAVTAWGLVRRPALGFLGFVFFALMAPTSLIPVATEPMAEHRMYLPLAVVIVVGVGTACLGRQAAGGIRHLGGRNAAGCRVYEGRTRWAWGAPLVAIAVLLGLLTVRRNRVYQSEKSLWSDTLAKRPGNERAHLNWGNVLDKEPGRSAEALAEYQEAVHLRPSYAEAHFDLGCEWQKMPGHLADAIAEFEEALRLKPDFAEAHGSLGSALELEPGRSAEAIGQFEAAVRLAPESAAAHSNLGGALLENSGPVSAATAQFEAALRLDPQNAAAHVNLALALLNQPGRTGEAAEHLRAALRLQPGNAAARELLRRVESGEP